MESVGWIKKAYIGKSRAIMGEIELNDGRKETIVLRPGMKEIINMQGFDCPGFDADGDFSGCGGAADCPVCFGKGKLICVDDWRSLNNPYELSRNTIHICSINDCKEWGICPMSVVLIMLQKRTEAIEFARDAL